MHVLSNYRTHNDMLLLMYESNSRTESVARKMTLSLVE